MCQTAAWRFRSDCISKHVGLAEKPRKEYRKLIAGLFSPAYVWVQNIFPNSNSVKTVTQYQLPLQPPQPPQSVAQVPQQGLPPQLPSKAVEHTNITASIIFFITCPYYGMYINYTLCF
ncbi:MULTISPECIES: hypothetical protein [Legionella]|uniref:Uncharacterized protein n=1 Tax=Legionella resiliens TaxID=2905958 RepID=A0ABS8X611_9GAMM|nr:MULTISPECIES: hypothetical protein [unclassified Legionella]MCE0724118.1 hypothetical protein [Legionella sp. 9fVS26]MCE3533271.1 hypothetical protein [Legionella sp. 8cVS16]